VYNQPVCIHVSPVQVVTQDKEADSGAERTVHITVNAEQKLAAAVSLAIQNRKQVYARYLSLLFRFRSNVTPYLALISRRFSRVFVTFD